MVISYPEVAFHMRVALAPQQCVLQVVDAANAAQQCTQEMQAECAALQEENQHLQAVVRNLEVQVSELQADAETRGSALESLEQTLGKIERSVETGRDRSPITGTCVMLPIYAA